VGLRRRLYSDIEISDPSGIPQLTHCSWESLNKSAEPAYRRIRATRDGRQLKMGAMGASGATYLEHKHSLAHDCDEWL
jgi:hypothetical protein